MHLERIEMSGFKSFADKTVIEFDKGVTAVVGPNGSGKSNLSEAVRWVMGEQSARNLRGRKMDDVIFAGSQSRRPVNIAEVTLVLNNEDRLLPLDFSQISITRRFNRNGDSDFFINKKACRMKDITELFMDSGIGKDSFSMISQGKVEQIFQNRPEERRGIFEDAAGVAKYKSRKTSAERKLLETEDHLNRVEDILHEVKNQLGPLERQKNTALAYQDLKQQLSEIEIALAAVEIETLHEQWTLAKKNIEQLQKQIDTTEREKTRLQEEIKVKKESSAALEIRLQTMQDEYVRLVQELEKAEARKSILEQRAAFSDKNKAEQQRLINEKKEIIEKNRQRLRSCRQEIQELTEQKRQLGKERSLLIEREAQLSEDQSVRLQQLRNEYIGALQEQSSHNNALNYLEKELGAGEIKRPKLAVRLEELKSRISALKEEEQTLRTDAAQKAERYQQNRAEWEAGKEQQDRLQQQLQKMTVTVQELTRSLQQAEARRESQQELQDSYASYYQGVKEILKRKKSLPGVHGSVAELIEVPEELTLAVETALGASMQHIVVSDSAAASQCITILKQNRLGRATFLPIAVIQGRTLPKSVQFELEQLTGYRGVASELIRCADSYQQIVSSLLGTTLIVDDLQHALLIAKKIGQRYRIVTLEGDVIHAGGSMTGGASKYKSEGSIFSRKNTIQKLTDYIRLNTGQLGQLKQQQQQLEAAAAEIGSKVEISKQNDSRMKYELDQSKLLLTQLQQNLAQAEKELAGHTFELKLFTEEMEEKRRQFRHTKKRQETLAAEILGLKTQMEKSSGNEEQRQRLLQEVSQKRQAVEQELAVQAVREKQLKKERQTAEEIVEQESQAIDALEGRQNEEARLADDDVLTIQELEIQLQQLSKTKQNIEKELRKSREEKKAVDLLLASREEFLNQNTDQLKALWSQLTKVETSAGRYETGIDHHLLHLSDEYGLSYEAAKAEYTLDLSVEEASAEVKRLKQALEELGSVNLASIEEFEKVNERFRFITAQQTDLLTARGNLLNTMGEMDEEVSQRFRETFTAIKNQFEKTFPRLFGGGKATLELTDPDDLLETGIEIVAQPPGKKLQQLSLLSGGEKAFTAIALLFSIIEVRPVPFCILDEVEAALDEANVARFGKYLKSFEEQTQFIVITHRKGTMEEADVLYGVTMQDSGVSRLASVKFADYVEM